jgi:hypothetical protein
MHLRRDVKLGVAQGDFGSPRSQKQNTRRLPLEATERGKLVVQPLRHVN